MYSFGNGLRVTLFGKSHAEKVGCIVEGLPKGLEIDARLIDDMMGRRRPSPGIGTSRREPDRVVFESGTVDGRTTGSPLMLSVANTNVDSGPYSRFNRTPRPGHADLPALMRFKDFDVAGGAQFSGRMTAPLVAAGAIAMQVLGDEGVRIAACTKSIYRIEDGEDRTFGEMLQSRAFQTHACTKELDSRMSECIESAKTAGDSVGGVVSCAVEGLPAGFGGIWFDALDSSLARTMFSIPGVKAVGFGKGFGISGMKGSESNDQYRIEDGRIAAESNNMGGVCGGMADGMPVRFDVAFKPTPSIALPQRTVDLETMSDAVIEIGGRHDPCIVPRAVVVVEAMAALTVLDQRLSFPMD